MEGPVQDQGVSGGNCLQGQGAKGAVVTTVYLGKQLSSEFQIGLIADFVCKLRNGGMDFMLETFKVCEGTKSN